MSIKNDDKKSLKADNLSDEDLPEDFFDDLEDNKEFLKEIEKISTLDGKSTLIKTNTPRKSSRSSKHVKSGSPDSSSGSSNNSNIPGKRCSLINKIRELEKDIARRRRKLKADEPIKLPRKYSRERSRTKSPISRVNRYNFKGKEDRRFDRDRRRSPDRDRKNEYERNKDKRSTSPNKKHNKSGANTERNRSTKSTTRSISFLEELAQKFAEKGQAFPEMESMKNNTFHNQNTNSYSQQQQHQQHQPTPQMDYNPNINYVNPQMYNMSMPQMPMMQSPDPMMYPMNNFMPIYNNYDGINYNNPQQHQSAQQQPQPPYIPPSIKSKNPYQKPDVFAKLPKPSPTTANNNVVNKIDDTQNFLDKNMKLSVLLNTKVSKVQTKNVETQTNLYECKACTKRNSILYENIWTQTTLIERSVIPTQTTDDNLKYGEMTPAQLMILNDFSKILRHSDTRVVQEILYNISNPNKMTNDNKNMHSENRNMLSDNRNMLPDNRNMLPDNRNMLPDNRNMLSDNRNMLSDNRNMLPDNRMINENRNIDRNPFPVNDIFPNSGYNLSNEYSRRNQQIMQQPLLPQQSSSNSFLTSKQIMDIERNNSNSNTNIFLNTNPSNKMLFDKNTNNNNTNNSNRNGSRNDNSNYKNNFGGSSNNQQRYNRKF